MYLYIIYLPFFDSPVITVFIMKIKMFFIFEKYQCIHSLFVFLMMLLRSKECCICNRFGVSLQNASKECAATMHNTIVKQSLDIT